MREPRLLTAVQGRSIRSIHEFVSDGDKRETHNYHVMGVKNAGGCPKTCTLHEFGLPLLGVLQEARRELS